MLSMLRDLRVSRKITLAFAILVLTMAMVMGFVVLKIDRADTLQSETRATLDRLTALDRVEGAVVDQQNGVRGFIISGDPETLAPYKDGRESYATWMGRLKAATQDEASAREQVGRLDAVVTRWREEVAERQIALMRHPDTVARARALEATGAGAAAMATFQDIHAQLTEAAEAALAQRSERQKAAFDWVYLAAASGGVIVLLAALAFRLWLYRSLGGPIARMTTAMTELAEGSRDSEIPDTDRRDEVGEMARAVQVFKQAMERNDAMAREAAAQQEARAERARKLEELTTAFDSTVSELMAALASAAGQLETTAGDMSSVAEETTRQSTSAASAAEQASGNVEAVAGATDQLASSVREITRQMSQSAQIAATTSKEAGKANDVVQELDDNARKIGEVVNLINDIAEQTNLLALNATIEAARAGEAGKGFAVVAQEVKSLANQTSQATDQISRQIAGMQSATGSAVTALRQIIDRISEMHDITTTVASAVEEQQSATDEIARNVEQAASGASEVSRNVTGVNEAASSTGRSAEQVLSASQSLKRESGRLQGEVDQFLAAVRAV